MLLSIVILSYNSKDLVINCLQSLTDQYKEELGKGEVEIIVVDNDSKDSSYDTISKFASNYKNIKIFESGSNLGFAKGCNFGAQKASGKYVLFLNSDTKTQDRGFLKMAEFLKNNRKIVILGGKLLNSNGTSQKSAGKFYNLFNFLLMIIGLERLGMVRSSPLTISEIDWVSGACMMVNKDIFDKIGKFDENIFMYIEDMELCFRAKKTGFSTYFYPDLRLVHLEHGSSSRSFAIKNIYKEILYFYKKHMPLWQYSVFRTFLIFKAKLFMIFGSANLKIRYSEAMSAIK